jgi:hypothetical protein
MPSEGKALAPNRHSEVERSGAEESELIYLEKKYLSSYPFAEGYELRFFTPLRCVLNDGWDAFASLRSE